MLIEVKVNGGMYCYICMPTIMFFSSFLLGFTKTNTNEADLNVKYRLGLTCQKACFQTGAQWREIDVCFAILLLLCFLFIFFFYFSKGLLSSFQIVKLRLWLSELYFTFITLPILVEGWIYSLNFERYYAKY